MPSGRKFKVVHDAVHGSIKMSEGFLPLMESPEIARLRGIKQLGLAHLVYPGANHSRFEHSIGTGFIAGKIASELELSKEDSQTLFAAGMLHDIGHNPFSHTLESTLKERTGKDHMEVTGEMITGKYDVLGGSETAVFGKRRTLREILEAEGICPEIVADLVLGNKKKAKPYMAQIIHWKIDADQIDYLLRDSFYTGVAYGTIDSSRLFQTLTVVDDELSISKNGIAAAESQLVARALMYSTVYFHKTVRIAELQLKRAFERITEKIPKDTNMMTDCEFTSYMESLGGLQKETMTRIKFRKLYKAAYSRPISEIRAMGAGHVDRLVPLADDRKRMELENELARKAGLPEGSVIVDIPEKDILVNEPRLRLTDIPIWDGEKMRSLSEFSPLAKALQARNIPEWGVLVSCVPEAREKVAALARKEFE